MRTAPRLILIASVIAFTALTGCVSNAAKEEIGPYSVTFKGIENYQHMGDKVVPKQFTTDTGVDYTEYGLMLFEKGDSDTISIAIDKYSKPMYEVPGGAQDALIKLVTVDENTTIENATIGDKQGILVRKTFIYPEGYSGTTDMTAFWVDPQTRCIAISTEGKTNEWSDIKEALMSVQIET